MRFFLGDDNGQLKSVRCTKSLEKGWKIDVALLDDGGRQGKAGAIQQLAVQGNKIAIARGNGSTSTFIVEELADSTRMVRQWEEARFKPGEDQFVGLALTADNQMISCTSAGHLRRTYADGAKADDVVGMSSQATAIPNRLCEWILSEDAQSFAYGGDEVEVSVWDTSRAFDPSRCLLPSSAVGTKRKKGQKVDLIDGEIWRAKNVSNDSLNLRQPVHNTSVAYLSSTSNGKASSHDILAGTRLGSVRRYDTRAARKPVSNWKDVGKVGGIRKVQRGNSEHEAFAADYGSNLVALDLRTGRVLYAYKGFAGAVSSLAPTTHTLHPPLLASTSLDRFFHLHSAYSAPQDLGTLMADKGETLAKVWVKSAAGCVVWDGCVLDDSGDEQLDEDKEDGDIWAKMKGVGEEDGTSSTSEDEERGLTSKKKKAR